jgi:hypothetical protein
MALVIDRFTTEMRDRVFACGEAQEVLDEETWFVASFDDEPEGHQLPDEETWFVQILNDEPEEIELPPECLAWVPPVAERVVFPTFSDLSSVDSLLEEALDEVKHHAN